MTNAEFYKDEIKNYKGENFCEDFIRHKILKEKECCKECCVDVECAQCHMIQAAWLLEEHKEPEVDWENVSIDTPILIRDSDFEKWEKRHFAGVNEAGNVLAWLDGRTSFTSLSRNAWKQAKLWEGYEEQAEEQRKREAEE